METLTFRSRYDYSHSRTGIEVTVILKVTDGRSVRLPAKVDTGAAFCIFQRDYAEQLGIHVESGAHEVVSTPNGKFDVYGHTLTLSCLDWEFETMVYFAAPPEYPRNVLGRSGWLHHFRMAIIDHDALLFLSHYND